MTKIVFITSGEIDYQFDGLSLYGSIKRTALGERFPGLSKIGNDKVLKTVKGLKGFCFCAIYTAPSRQCLETARIFSKYLKIPLRTSKRLSPLRFNIKNIFSEKEFKKLGDNKFFSLRQGFINNFLENKLFDNNREISKRLICFRKKIKREYEGKNVLFVSHAYLIKLFSIYYKYGEKMFKDRELLLREFNIQREPLTRLQTLTIKL